LLRDLTVVRERLNKKLLDEYLVYPYSAHDDGLNSASRGNDMNMHPPRDY
jgi:hypothetical protein